MHREHVSCLKLLAGCLLMTLHATAAGAFDWTTPAKVTVIEPSYMPGWISFQIGASVGTCPSGTWLQWTAQGADQSSRIANVQAVYSTLLTAMMANRTLTFFGVNAGCKVEHIHLIGI